MKFVVILVSILNLSVVIGDEEYKRWAEPLANHGYSWEAVPVTTDDDYELTLFRVFGRYYKANKPPVLIVHDTYADAATWIEM